jgi:PAS domain-containing protein
LAIENADNYTDIVFSEDRPEVDQLLESQISNGIETELKQYRIVTKSGEIRWVLDYIQIIKEDSGEYAVYGYMVI